MTDDLTKARAKRIAMAKSPDEIRASIRNAARFCPRCGRLLRQHSDAELDSCARHLGDIA